jgi:hypothetical protein
MCRRLYGVILKNYDSCKTAILAYYNKFRVTRPEDKIKTCMCTLALFLLFDYLSLYVASWRVRCLPTTRRLERPVSRLAPAACGDFFPVPITSEQFPC